MKRPKITFSMYVGLDDEYYLKLSKIYESMGGGNNSLSNIIEYIFKTGADKILKNKGDK